MRHTEGKRLPHESTLQLIRKWLLECTEHHRLTVDVGVGGIFLLVHFTPTQFTKMLLSGYLINRCQMGVLTKQLWPSDSAFYVASQPVNPAAFAHRPLHCDLLPEPTQNAQSMDIACLNTFFFLNST